MQCAKSRAWVPRDTHIPRPALAAQWHASCSQELDELDAPGFELAAGVERVVRTGTPFVEIVRYAREKDIDVIVMGTHGHSGLVHAMIGSVAEKVVRKAGCPVLTVRPEGHQFVMP
jgi:nucleotide-binding universal stress UspA family protein